MSTTAPVLRATSIYFTRLRRSGQASLLVAGLNPLFVLGAMGLGLGSLIDDNRAASLGGVEYLAFIAPGLMAAFAMQSAAGNSLWPVLGGIKWEGTYIAQVSTPLRPTDVLAGQLAYTASDIGVRIVMTFAAMLVFGAVQSGWGVLSMPAALLTGMVYATAVTAFAATQETDVTFPLIMRLGVIPSYLFSGTFFPIEQLPSGLQAVAKVTPLWHGVDLCRSLTLGDATLAGSLVHVTYLAICFGVALAWGRRTFERRLHE